jgi:uncharacterized Tic20 family protein
MSNSYLNIVTFLLTTIFYYLALKPALPLSLYKDKQQYTNYVSKNYIYLAIYVLLVILVQFMVNSSIIASSCGGNITENMGASGELTFLPWILIFGVLVLVLTVYPGFKSAFSDVIGYYYVSSSSTKLLTELLVNQDTQKKMIEDPNMTPEKKAALETASDTINKICGNTSILINQIVPSNFEQYWGILTPLMKDKYKMDGPETDKIQGELLELVVTRDNIGEAMWYIYTGLLVTSIVQLKITTKGCNSNTKNMEQKFLEKEQQAKTSTS